MGNYLKGVGLMTGKKQADPLALDMSFEDAMARFMTVDPRNVAVSIAAELARQREDAKRRLDDTRKELEDGARARAGRFRL
jgi:hypothetical protein